MRSQLKAIRLRSRTVRAVGGTRELILYLQTIAEASPLEDGERAYIIGRLLPITEDAYDAAIHSEGDTMRLGGYSLILPFASSMVSLVSSGFVPPEQQGYSLVFLGLFTGLQALLTGYLVLRPPGLDWLNARRVFGTLTKEISMRLALAGDYASLTDAERYQLLQARCEAAILQTEQTIAQQIQSSLTVSVPDPKKDKEGAGSSSEAKEACAEDVASVTKS